MNVAVICAFEVVSVEDGLMHLIEAFGEALDGGDMGTAKAMQSAYKHAVLQAFCIPVPQTEDADARSHRLTGRHTHPEPAEGWPQWGRALEHTVASCETPNELTSLQEQRRSLLASLSRERPELYNRIGKAMVARRSELSSGTSTTKHTAAQLIAPKTSKIKTRRA